MQRSETPEAKARRICLELKDRNKRRAALIELTAQEVHFFDIWPQPCDGEFNPKRQEIAEAIVQLLERLDTQTKRNRDLGVIACKALLTLGNFMQFGQRLNTLATIEKSFGVRRAQTEYAQWLTCVVNPAAIVEVDISELLAEAV